MRIKTILIAILDLLVVLLGGATIYVMSIDYTQYKGLIASEVERATAESSPSTARSPALSLTPTLTIKDLSLANLPGGSQARDDHAEASEVQMQLLPLLSRQVKIDPVVLRAPISCWRPTRRDTAIGSSAMPRAAAPGRRPPRARGRRCPR
jgi:uncharacterized protein involved in outer membrane biogenesis